MLHPRLGSRVRARRHLVEAESRVILHAPDGRVLGIGDREWRVIAAMDGTRDLAGIAAKSAVSPAEVEHFVRALDRLGLLEEGTEPNDSPAAENAFPPDRPVRPLPSYRFRCDGSGGCCRMFGTVVFTPLEAARARAARPDVLDGGQHAGRVFMPERGLDETLLAVAMRDGGCAYLESDGRCGIHAAAGADRKPFGCRTFPARFVDVGDEIRVVPRPECACVFDEAGDAPLTEAARGAELPLETHVPRLPERIRLGSREVDGAAFVAWCDARSVADDEDAAAYCERLARELDGAPDPLPGFRRSVRRLERQHADWRSERDLVRRATAWIAEAADALGSGAEGPVRDPRAERLVVRAAFFGATFVDAPTVAEGLRGLALRIRLGRVFPEEARAFPEARHPLALIEGIARGHLG